MFVYDVLGFDMGKIVCDNDSCVVFAPALEFADLALSIQRNKRYVELPASDSAHHFALLSFCLILTSRVCKQHG
jgi:hypothetical protein